MRPVNTWLIPAAATLALGSAQSFACSCSTVVVDRSPDQEKQEWLESMALGSETVVLARVTYVAPYSDGGGNAGDYGVLEVREVLKGSPLPTIDVTTGWCSDFSLELEDERVFFVLAGGRVRPCSEYRHAMSDEEAAARLRK